MDEPKVTVTVTDPTTGVTRIIPPSSMQTGSVDCEFDHFDNGDGSFTAVPRPKE